MMSDVGLYDIMFLRDLINLVCVDCAANSREVPVCPVVTRWKASQRKCATGIYISINGS